MLLSLSVLLYVLSTIPVIALTRIKRLPAWLCAFFVVFVGEIILTGSVLGLLQRLNSVGAWFIVQAFLFLIVWGFWFLRGCPSLFAPEFTKPDWRSLSLLRKIILIVLGLFLAAGYGIVVYLILAVPPNNIDSMLVHLVRVGYWLQHGSFAPWDSLIERQVIYPYNAQIVVLWSILLHGTDKFAAFLQFFSVLFTALGIYGIGREIGGDRFQSALPALFYLTFPQVVLQASTTQDDMVITCFLVIGTYFFLRWYRASFKTKVDLLLCASGFAIAIGVKPTAFYFFTGFAVFLVLLLFVRKMKIRRLIHFGAASLACFAVFSSYAYINNTVNFHNPLGPAEFVESESGLANPSIFQKTGVNFGRFVYQFFSLDGLTETIYAPFQNLKIAAASRLPGVFDTGSDYLKDAGKPFDLATPPGINEDYSWFGPVSFLLLVPAFIVGIVKAIKKKDPKIALLLLVPICMLLSISLLRPGWDPYQGRYINPGIALTMPLVIFLLDRKVFHDIYASLITILAVMVLIGSVIINDAKPLLTQATIKRTFQNPAYACDRNFVLKYVCYFSNVITPGLPAKADLYALNDLQRLTYSSHSQYTVFSQIYAEVPPNAHIGLSLLVGDWEYPYFGRNFEYKLFPITNTDFLHDEAWLQDNQIEYLVVHSDNGQTVVVVPGYILQQEIPDEVTESTWRLYKYQ